MPTQQNIDLVQDIKERLERSTIAVTTSYSGISVNQMVELRRAMRGGGIDFAIVKNTLLSLAAEAAQKPQLKEIVDGPTAIAFGYDDPVDAAKVLADYIRSGRSRLAIQGAVMGYGAAMTPDEFTNLASLPPRAQLLSMLLGQMQAPIARLLTVLNGPLQALDNVLQARVRQMEEDGPAPAPEPEAAAEPEATPEATVEATPEATIEATGEESGEAEEAPVAEAEPEPEPAAEEEPADEEATEPEPEPEPEAESDGETESE